MCKKDHISPNDAVFFFQTLQAFQRLRALTADAGGKGNHQCVQHHAGSGHRVVFLLGAAVGKEVNLRAFLWRKTGSADKGQGGVTGCFGVVENDPSLPAELGKAEQNHQVPLTCQVQSLQQLRAAGGQQRNGDSQPPEPEKEQLRQRARGIFAVNINLASLYQRLHRALKFCGIKLFSRFLQIKLLAVHPGRKRKALPLLQGACQLDGRTGGGLFQHQIFQLLKILAANMPRETGKGGVGQLQLLRQLANGRKEKGVGVGIDKIQDFLFGAGQFRRRNRELQGHGLILSDDTFKIKAGGDSLPLIIPQFWLSG